MPSRIWGTHAGTGEIAIGRSPLNGEPVQRVQMLSSYELDTIFQYPFQTRAIRGSELSELGSRVCDALMRLETEFFAAMRLETGFSFYDCREMLAGAIQLASDVERIVTNSDAGDTYQEYEVCGRIRRISLIREPWNTVALILPQNAFLIIALTGLFNAVAAGSRVVLRAPLQSARSACLLTRLLELAEFPEDRVSVVLAPSLSFCEAIYRSPHEVILHYMGSSRHAGRLMQECFENGTPLIVDGEGNGWAYVGESFDPTSAAKILSRAALRYAGQTCTSINGALIHPAAYGLVRAELKRRFEESSLMPLLDPGQADWCLERVRLSSGSVIAGGRCIERKLEPTLVESPRSDSQLVREGVFGPVLWISQGDICQFETLWRTNRYPLCAAVLSHSDEEQSQARRLKGLARLTINGDSSIESVFEPWGGYPMSGVNAVGPWIDKYMRTTQIDEPT